MLVWLLTRKRNKMLTSEWSFGLFGSCSLVWGPLLLQHWASPVQCTPSAWVETPPPPPFFHTITLPPPPPPPRCHSLSNSTYRCFTSPPPPHSNHISATGLEFRFDSQTYANRQGLDTSWRWTRFLEKVQTAQRSRRAYKTPEMFFSVTFLSTRQGHGFAVGLICKSCAALTNCVFVLALWWE